MAHLIATLNPGETTYTDTDILPSSGYFYEIFVIDSFGNKSLGTLSNFVSTPPLYLTKSISGDIIQITDSANIDKLNLLPKDNVFVSESISSQLITYAALWDMNELSGNIVDSKNGIILEPYANNYYNISAGTPQDPGVILGAAGAGFYKRSATTALEPGMQDFEFEIDEWVYTPNNESFQISYLTAVANAGVPGFEFSWTNVAASKARKFFIRDSAGNQDTVTWTHANITTAYNSGAYHTHRVYVDRSAKTAEYFLDDTSYGTQSLPNTVGSITSSGVGIGQDYRAGINRDNKTIIFRVWQKHYS